MLCEDYWAVIIWSTDMHTQITYTREVLFSHYGFNRLGLRPAVE
jgi:hypothetical protein